MEEEQVVIRAGPVGIVLGKKTREDINKLRFLVSLAGTYEYVKAGTLRILCSKEKKAVDKALAEPKVKSRISYLGAIDGSHYIAADLESSLHLLRLKHSCFKPVDEAEMLRVLQEASDDAKS